MKKGYMLLNSNMISLEIYDIQEKYEIGKIYDKEEYVVHENILDCLFQLNIFRIKNCLNEKIHNLKGDKIYVEVELLDNVKTIFNAITCNKIKILREVKLFDIINIDNLTYEQVKLILKFEKLSEEQIEKCISKYKDKEEHWSIICKYQSLSDLFIENHADKIYWHYLGMYQTLSEYIIDKYFDRFSSSLKFPENLSEEFLKKHYKDIPFEIILNNLKKNLIKDNFDKLDSLINTSDFLCIISEFDLPEKLLIKYLDKLDYECILYIIKYYNLSEKFIEKYVFDINFYKQYDIEDDIYKIYDYYNQEIFSNLYDMYHDENYDEEEYKKECFNIAIKNILIHQKLSESFIEKHLNKFEQFNLSNILRYQKVSESFIEKHLNKFEQFNLSNILRYQKVSESFIEKYLNDLKEDDWRYAFHYQTLSENFIEKHLDKFNLLYILKYQKVSENFIEKHLDKISLFDLQEHPHNVSIDFMNKYKYKIYEVYPS